MKRPRPGPEWSRLWAVVAELAADLDPSRPLTGNVTLSQTDAAWLCELLNAIGTGEDVSQRFMENKKPRPEAERHFWIACDYAQHVHERIKPAAREVAERWNLSHDEGAETVRTIVKRQRPHVQPIRHLLGPGFARVIDWQRARILGS